MINDAAFAELIKRLEYSRQMEDQLAQQLELTVKAMHAERETQRKVIGQLFNPVRTTPGKPKRGRPRKVTP